MTVVIACRFLKSVSVIADCRVSDGGRTEADDNLQKIYPLDNRMVVGFSGPLAGAYQVLDAIRRNRRAYSKRPVATNLLTDVERWIRHEYREIKQPKNRKGLSFILAAVEPRREARSRWRTSQGEEKPKPKWFPYVPELRVLALKPSQSKPNELVKQERGMCKIIGVPVEIRNAIQDRIESMYSFAFRQPKLQARAIVDALMLTLMESQVNSVGGLFQCAILSADGIEWLTYRLRSDLGDVALDIVEGQYIQRDNVTGRTVPLMTIWQWWKEWQANRQPGRFGVFEDPALRKAVNDSQKAQEDQIYDSDERNIG